jgi:hypothetical protein
MADRRHAPDAVTTFDAAHSATFPKAVAKISDDVEELLAFYDYPDKHSPTPARSSDDGPNQSTPTAPRRTAPNVRREVIAADAISVEWAAHKQGCGQLHGVC